MGAVGGYAGAERTLYDALLRGVAGDTAGCMKYQRMMGHDKIATTRLGFLNHLLRGIKGQKHAGTFPVGMAYLKS